MQACSHRKGRFDKMEHILISPGKLKLMLTKSDLDRYQLDCDTIDEEGALTRQSFRELLDDVKRVSGFDAADDKVFIQFYPSRDGGAEIYITRLQQRRDRQYEGEDASIRILSVCSFESMQRLLEACAHMSHALPHASSAWCGEGKYYLILEDQIACRDYLRGIRPLEKRRFIGDYGQIILDQTAIHYVKEHCFCFCEKNAVKILSDMV